MRRMALILACLVLAASMATANDEAGDEENFTPLFDGHSFAGWVGATDDYEIADGLLSSKADGNGNLYTERTYANFVLRFEFRLTPGANNGVALRAPLEGDPAYVGLEAQILDNSAERYAELQPHQYHGSVYGVAPAKRGHLRPVGEWNQQQICCRGRKVYVWLNGEPIVTVDLDEAAPGGKTIDGREHPGLARREGHIGFLGHGTRVDFRNIRIRETP